MATRYGARSRAYSGGSSWVRSAPRSMNSLRSPVVTRSWKPRKLSPPGRPSQCSSTGRFRDAANVSSTSSTGVPSQSGLVISARKSRVSGSMPRLVASGATVCWARRSGATNTRSSATSRSRQARSSACCWPRSVRSGSSTLSPRRSQAGSPCRMKRTSTATKHTSRRSTGGSGVAGPVRRDPPARPAPRFGRGGAQRRRPVGRRWRADQQPWCQCRRRSGAGVGTTTTWPVPAPILPSHPGQR